LKFSTYSTQIKKAWSEAWLHRSFRIQIYITLIVILTFPFVINEYFEFIENRSGALLNDVLLVKLPSYNVSWIIFFFLYGGIFIGLYYHLIHPKTILITFQTYVIITLIRFVTITLVPLEPPIGYIPLREPFVQLFSPNGRIFSKDLFFSGHMSTILSLFFSSHRKFVRTILFFCSCMVGSLILIQHVHYTIDVLVAIPATYFVYLFCKKYLAGNSYNLKSDLSSLDQLF
jgi:hypothetical protein